MKKQSRAWNLDHSKPANSGVPSLVKGPHDRSLFDSESFSFVETDLSGYIVDSNPALARMLLFPEGGLIGYALSRLVPDKWHGKEAAVNAQLMQHGVT
ncbi:MAG TPA: hypothetical protein VFV82_13305, partial [Candidatus Binatia bacterium]|nr:hypothetical protein [Candidatus Binatia bacterium]